MTLLPFQRRIADLMGLTEDEYLHFVYECHRLSREELDGEVVAGIDPISLGIGAIVVGIGSSLAAAALAPKPPPPPQTPGDVSIREDVELGATTRTATAATSATSIQSSQQVAVQGEIIPAIYAKQEADGIGGVRINLKLVFSQILAQKSHQVARLLYAIGQGELSGINYNSFAFGDNTLASYYLDASYLQYGGRFTIYSRLNGGRIQGADYRLGRPAQQDPGNVENQGGGDVFQVLHGGSAILPLNCMTGRPGSSTSFGLTNPIGNGLGYRVNPRLRPTKLLEVQGVTEDFATSVGYPSAGSNAVYFMTTVDDDTTALGLMWKSIYMWSTRSGIVSFTRVATGQTFIDGLHDVAPGDQIKYTLSSDNDAPNELKFNDTNVDNNLDDNEETLTEIGGGVASRQRTWDNYLVEGEVYRIGSCLAVLSSRATSRQNEPSFISGADTEPYGIKANGVTCTFTVVESGKIFSVGNEYLDSTQWSTLGAPPYNPGGQHFPPQTSTGGDGAPNEQTRTFEKALLQNKRKFKTATNCSHIFRIVNGGFTLARPARFFEVGIQSTLGIQVSGLCNFKDAKDLDKINRDATRGYGNKKILSAVDDGDGFEVDVKIYQSGTVSRSEDRYSFWTMHISKGANGPLHLFPRLIGVKGSSSVPVNNYLRFQMPTTDPWRVVFKPVSGWEVRSRTWPVGIDTGVTGGFLLDAGAPDSRNEFGHQWDMPAGLGTMFVWGAGRWLAWSNTDNPFRLETIDRLESKDLFIGDSDDKSMIDEWGKLAEMFVYDEISTTVSSTPEHQITHVNIIEEPTTPPSYADVAMLGINVRSSAELTSVGQASIDVTNGRKIAVWYNQYQTNLQPSHTWADILLDAFTNDRFGTGDIVSRSDIDIPSFIEAGRVTDTNRWYFDGVIDQSVNVRSWAAEVSASMLLRFGERNGKWYLKEARPLGAVQIKALFTADNVAEGTFSLTWREEADRDPPVVAVTYRNRRPQQQSIGSAYEASVFPEDTTLLVREASTNPQGRVVPLDLTRWVTSKTHAIDAAKFFCREISLTTHDVSFETNHDAGIIEELGPDDYFQINMQTTFYSDFNNGGVLADGTIVSAQPLVDGDYPVKAWGGKADTGLHDAVMHVVNGKADLPGQLFTIARSINQTRTYRVTRVAPTDDGRYVIDGAYAPTDANGVLLLASGWNDATKWDIKK